MAEEASKKATAGKTKTAKKATKRTTKRKRAAKTSARKTSKKTATKARGGLRVRQVRSGIGHAEPYRRTLRAIGLKHHQDEVHVADNPSMRGMLRKVRHLIEVTPVEKS